MNKLIPVFILVFAPVVHLYADAIAFLEFDGSYWQVNVMNNDGTVTKKITTSEYDKTIVSIFNEGKKIFVSGLQGQAEIVDIKTSEIESIKLPFESINDAVISPDGNKVLFSIIPKSTVNNKLWLYDFRKKEKSPILHHQAGRQYDPKWGSDSKTFYFISGVANQSYGIEKSFIGSNKSKIIVEGAHYNFDIDISTTGKLVYSSNRTGNYEIYTDDGITRNRITNFTGLDAHPVWSQNEKKIYYDVYKDGVSNIWSVKISSGETAQPPKQITFSKYGARYPISLMSNEL